MKAAIPHLHCSASAASTTAVDSEGLDERASGLIGEAAGAGHHWGP